MDSMVRNYAQMYESLVSVVPAPVQGCGRSLEFYVRNLRHLRTGA